MKFLRNKNPLFFIQSTYLLKVHMPSIVFNLTSSKRSLFYPCSIIKVLRLFSSGKNSSSVWEFKSIHSKKSISASGLNDFSKKKEYKAFKLSHFEKNNEFVPATGANYITTSLKRVDDNTFGVPLSAEMDIYRNLITFEVFDSKKLGYLSRFLGFLKFFNERSANFAEHPRYKPTIVHELFYNPADYKSSRDWVNKVLNLTNSVLNSVSTKNACMTNELYYRRVLFTKTVNEKKIKKGSPLSLSTSHLFKTPLDSFPERKEFADLGRLRNSLGVTAFPKELREYLFANQYIDVDIENAHPSILLGFAVSRDLYTPWLRKLVLDRESVYTELSLTTGWDRDVCKKSFLKLLNIAPGHPCAYIVPGLMQELVLIRKELYKAVKTNSIMYSEQFNKLMDYMLANKVPMHKCLISLQSYYSQTMESFHVQEFCFFLRCRYKDYLTDNNLSRLENSKFAQSIDKDISDLSHLDFLVTVPFFDGVFVHSPEKEFMSSLSSLIEQFNIEYEGVHTSVSDPLKKYITFTEKKIDLKINRLKDFLCLKRFTTMEEAIDSKHKHTKSVSLYFKYLGFDEKKVMVSCGFDVAVSTFEFYQYLFLFDLLSSTDKNGGLLQSRESFVSRIDYISEIVLATSPDSSGTQNDAPGVTV